MAERYPNALDQVVVTIPGTTLRGCSIAGVATYLQVPELDTCFDMGECPISALSLNHVFLTHAHGDHWRCLSRHWALRRMIGIEREPVYYLPMELVDPFLDLFRAEMRFEGVPQEDMELPVVVPVPAGGDPIPLRYRRDLSFTAFEVTHTAPSLGYTLRRVKRKLRPEFHGVPGHELARLRSEGVEIDREVQDPLVTFLGDHTAETLVREAHIWRSPILVVEATFLHPGEEDQAHRRGHTHLSEVAAVLRDRCTAGPDALRCEHLVLKHFSMRYTADEARAAVAAAIPPEFGGTVHPLV